MCGIVDAGHRFGLRIVVRVKLPRIGLRQAVGTGAWLVFRRRAAVHAGEYRKRLLSGHAPNGVALREKTANRLAACQGKRGKGLREDAPRFGETGAAWGDASAPTINCPVCANRCRICGNTPAPFRRKIERFLASIS